MSAKLNLTMGPVEWGLLVLLSTVWSASFFLVGVAIHEVPPLTMVLIRVGLAAIGLLLLVRLLGLRMPRDWRVWRALFIMGFLNNALPFSLIVFGQTQISGSLASILNASTPVFAVLAAHFLTADERLTPQRLLGVAFGFSGVAVMIGSEALGGVSGTLWGQLALIGTAVCYAFSGIFGRRFRTMGVGAIQTATGQITAATIWLLPVALIVDRPWELPMPAGTTIIALIALALVSTAFAYIIYFELLKRAGATNLLLVTLLVPVGAILLGTAFLGDVLEPSQLIGMGLIALGLIAIDGRLFRKLFGKRMEPAG